jgi:hypothetical protein
MLVGKTYFCLEIYRLYRISLTSVGAKLLVIIHNHGCVHLVRHNGRHVQSRRMLFMHVFDT